MRRRDYSGPGDLRAMQRSVQRTWTSESRWHVGDLAWGRYAIPGQEPNWRTALWEDRDAVVAWGWIELLGHLRLHVDPAWPELAGEVLAWFDEVVAGADGSVTVMDSDAHLVAALERAAYRPVAQAAGGVGAWVVR